MPDVQIIQDKNNRPVAAVVDIDRYQELLRCEQDLEYFRRINENPGLKKEQLPPAPGLLNAPFDPNRRRFDLFSALSHLAGVLLSIAGLVILLVAGASRTPWHVVSFSIFGAALILLYLSSTLYHWFPYPSTVRSVFQRIDHSMIYLLIAGTYTPVCLVAIRGPWGWTLFGIIWAMAIWGIIMKAAWLKIPRVISVLSYVLMGWSAVIAFVPLFQTVSLPGMLWIIGGGLFYTIGTLFYSLDKKRPSTRWFNWHDVFHLFILAGSFCHFWAMLWYINPLG